MRKLAISTSFRARIVDTAQEVLQATADLGLRAMELSYNLEPAMAEDMLTRLGQFEIEPVSLHHPCPLPAGVSKHQATGEPHNPASLNEEERKLSVRDILGTLEFAKRAGVKKVVFHAGGLDDAIQAEEDLNQKRKQGDPDWIALRDEMLRYRREIVDKHLDALRKTLDSVVFRYEEAGVALALETRFYFMNIPDITEFQTLFSEYPELAYWHDIGHVWQRANMGIEGEFDSLREFSHRLAGYHIHDASDQAGDHNAPGVGEIDFEKHLEPGLSRPGTAFVLEPARKVSFEDMLKGVKLIQEILNKPKALEPKGGF